MKTTQLQLVTYDQAKRLKELGFDWKSCTYYDNNGNEWLFCADTFEKEIEPLTHRPTVALALKWCRDVKIVSSGICMSDGKSFFGRFEYYGDCYQTITSNNFELTESDLLDEIMDILEKQTT